MTTKLQMIGMVSMLLVLGSGQRSAATGVAEANGAVCAVGVCAPVPVEVAAAVGVAAIIESACRKDKSRSCTGETKQALRTLEDIATGKKNGFKSLERGIRRLRDKIF